MRIIRTADGRPAAHWEAQTPVPRLAWLHFWRTVSAWKTMYLKKFPSCGNTSARSFIDKKRDSSGDAQPLLLILRNSRGSRRRPWPEDWNSGASPTARRSPENARAFCCCLHQPRCILLQRNAGLCAAFVFFTLNGPPSGKVSVGQCFSYFFGL